MEPIQKYMSQNEHKMQLIIKQRKIICIKRNYPINNRRFFVHWKIGCDSLNACCFISFHFIVICFIIWCVCARARSFFLQFYFILSCVLLSLYCRIQWFWTPHITTWEMLWHWFHLTCAVHLHFIYLFI